MWKIVYLYIYVELNILIHDTEQEGQRCNPQDDVDHVWKTGPPDTHPAENKLHVIKTLNYTMSPGWCVASH
jgi:hypothetical protein